MRLPRTAITFTCRTCGETTTARLRPPCLVRQLIEPNWVAPILELLDESHECRDGQVATP